MLRQSPSRNARTKGFKVKHAAQIFLLLTILIWLLYQVRHSYYEKKEYEDPTPDLLSDEIEPQEEVMKFGRKDLINVKGRKGKDEESGEEIEDAKVDEEEENLVEGRGGGDDEIDVNDQERAEEEDSESEMEDFIDEEDREKQDVGLAEETEGHAGGGKRSRKVKEEEESNLKLEAGGSVNNRDTSNREGESSFYRDGLIDQYENAERDAQAKKSKLRLNLLDNIDNRNII